jgi:hypothetical protein
VQALLAWLLFACSKMPPPIIRLDGNWNICVGFADNVVGRLNVMEAPGVSISHPEVLRL